MTRRHKVRNEEVRKRMRVDKKVLAKATSRKMINVVRVYTNRTKTDDNRIEEQ